MMPARSVETATLALPGITLREVSYPPNLVLGEHAHRFTVLALVLGGHFHERCDGVAVWRTPGTLRIIPAEAPHENRYRGRGARTFLTEIHQTWAAALAARVPALRRVSHHEPATRPARLAERLYAEFRIGDDLAKVAGEGIVLELLATASRCSKVGRVERIPPWLRRARDRCDTEFRQALPVNELARDVGVSATSLIRGFRRHLGCSPWRYVTHLRIAWVKEQLAATEHPIATIAVQAGFSDQAHLTRRFRREVGLTPASYRRGHTMPSMTPSEAV